MKVDTAMRNPLVRLFRADPDVVRYVVRVSVWGRWFIWLTGAALLARRSDLWYPENTEFVFLSASLAAINGVAHHRLLTHRPVTWRWMLALSALDIALITAFIAVSGRFDHFIFVTYYPALAMFAVVFPSLWLILGWVTATAVVYCLVVVVAGPGPDLEAGQDHVLAARLSVMYLIAVGAGLIVRFERSETLAAMARERQAHRERIDLSQSIHDTTAQTASMIGLGIEGALKLAGDSNPRLTERLAATAALSRSTTWELRRPIDMGRIFEGEELARVLDAHTATFASITSVPAEMVRSGDEPELSAEVRTGLFSIAHNALANAFLHARAGRIVVRLDFETDSVRLSVSDDGIGLPEDYAGRGRGFSGMERDARRAGGRLVVESGGRGGGTTIACVVPREPGRGGG
ncbi:MAG: ATP-binding protein [Chloroflexi bacterium]|nr:ATP-binding protein [Chloroflexota bacterium]